jgi:hypothetical protein
LQNKIIPLYISTHTNSQIKSMKNIEKITKQTAIQQVLYNALLLDGKMYDSLYKHELEEHIGYWTEGMI